MATLAFGCGDVVKLDANASCGDGEVTGDEECDTSAESGGCNADCTRAFCGDEKVNAMAGETCDDGDDDDANACNNACSTYTVIAPAASIPFTSTGVDGPFAPVGNIVLSSGIKNYTTINIPGGVTVRVAGIGSLDLRATGAVVIDGKIDVSGGDGGTGIVNATCSEGGAGGGATGTLVTGSNGSTGCPVPGPGGLGGSGLSPGVLWVAGCGTLGGTSGGGAGGGICNGGGGGGGYAGGGGGAGHSTSAGGAGAGAFGFLGGQGGIQNAAMDGVGKIPPKGGPGTNLYAGEDATFVTGGVSYPGTAGAGGAIGKTAESDLAVNESFYPGSGGGGGAGGCVCGTQGGAGGGGGGGGGGALRIASAASIIVSATGQLLANGGKGGTVSGSLQSGAGGGGSGGVIYLQSPTVTVATGAIVTAVGGVGVPSSGSSGKGGNGGLGRIRISAGATCSLAGAFTPAVANGCAPTNMAEKVFVATYPN